VRAVCNHSPEMRLSKRLRAALWENAYSGTAFLHVPKAAGTSVLAALKAASVPMVSYKDLRLAHRDQCRCGHPICRYAITMEERFLREVRTDRPWVLDLGHFALTADEVADLPPGLPIVVPLRNDVDRLVSLFLFDWTRYEYVRGMRAVITWRLTFAWNPRQRTRWGSRLMWGDTERAALEALVSTVPLMAAYLAGDGRSVLWREWAESALAPRTYEPFRYSELLPDLNGVDDPRWSRLVPVPMGELASWLERDFGAAMPHVNRSLMSFGDLDVLAAADELRTVVSDYVKQDASTWSQLQARLLEVAPP